ncbi:MAG TPA: ArsR family transcriptional regulator [Stellaceae bacterium]|nr:ArsR family transcriptional regulator [Stellaceae bacterium]
MKFSETIAADRRLSLLELLGRASGATANHAILHSGLDELGHRCSRDQVRTELAWLQEQGLVTLRRVEHGSASILVARLTERGEDAAKGRVRIPGVRAP